MPTIQLATSNSDVCKISKLKSLPSRLNQSWAILYFMTTSIVTIIDIQYFVSILMISNLGEMFHQTFRIHVLNGVFQKSFQTWIPLTDRWFPNYLQLKSFKLPNWLYTWTNKKQLLLVPESMKMFELLKITVQNCTKKRLVRHFYEKCSSLIINKVWLKKCDFIFNVL